MKHHSGVTPDGEPEATALERRQAAALGSFAQFTLAFGAVAVSLSESLGMTFADGQSGGTTSIGQALRTVLDDYNAKRYAKCAGDLAKLQLLAKNILEIRQANELAFNALRSGLRRCRKPDTYNGLRMEVNAAASFARKGTPFTKRESPDFEIRPETGRVFIECGSCYRATDSSSPVPKKLHAAIAAKSNKQYATAETALFLDWTNLVYYEASDANRMDTDAVRGTIRLASGGRGYGSILLFSYYIVAGDGIGSMYLRQDRDGCDARLAAYLDQAFPRGTLELTGALFPYRA